MTKPTSDLAFTPAVKALQEARGSRAAYAKREAENRHGGGVFRTLIDDDLRQRLAETFSFYLATVNGEGHPYIQHRGGPPGFLVPLDGRTLAFADFAGNRQYITTGNLSENPRAHIFMMDYVNLRRVKIWGRARIVTGDEALLARVMPHNYKARAEQVIVFDVTAWDLNCPQHIPQMFPSGAVIQATQNLRSRIAELEAEVARLKSSAD
jgi:uncharacterized protein